MAGLVVAPLVLDSARVKRAVGAGCLSLALVALWLSGSRGAWLGFALGAFILVLLLRTDKTARRRLLLTLVVITILSAALLLPSITERFSADGWAGRTVTGRLLLWERVGSLALERPLLGWGPETLEYVFPRAAGENWAERMPTATVVDNGHNVLLHSAYSSGVAAAGLLLFLAVLLARDLWSRARRDPPDPAATGLAAAMVAYGTALLFHPSLPHTTAVFSVYAGAVAAYAWPPRSKLHGKTSRAAGPLDAAVEGRWIVAGLLAIAAMWALGGQVRTWQADRLLRSAIEAEAAFELEEASALALDAQRAAPHEVAYGRYAAGILLKTHGLTGDSIALSEARSAALRATEANPLDAASWRLLANALSTEGADVSAASGAAANALVRADELDPFRLIDPFGEAD
jgi:hypothetical protein